MPPSTTHSGRDAETRPSSTELTWQRHSGDSRFHAGAPGEGSFITLCDGRWSLIESAIVERQENPPATERCTLCELRAELAVVRRQLGDKENELHLVEREFSDTTARLEDASLEAVELVLRVDRRGFMTPIEQARAGALARLVPE